MLIKSLILIFIALCFYGCSSLSENYIDYLDEHMDKKVSLSEVKSYGYGYKPIHKHGYIDEIIIGTDERNVINHIYLKKEFPTVESCNNDYNNLMNQLTSRHGEPTKCKNVGTWSDCLFPAQNNSVIIVGYRDDQMTVLWVSEFQFKNAFGGSL